MQPQTQVIVDLAGGAVPGLVLRTGHDGQRLLVTYEDAGRVRTDWVDRSDLRAPQTA